ncbi:MAG TPA: TonB-dependent receptor plug domain-containing protein [Cyclobacteriaceae bacterium]|nr:TonB-dependent receptor plug domain-containing protein [Cyclobacteriaceae bacterium]
MKSAYFFIIAVFSLFLIQCKTGRQTTNSAAGRTGSANAAASTVETPNSTLALVDYLRRVPGIQVTGSGNNVDIRIRNAVTLGQGESSPLYVIDNIPAGDNYSAVASMIDVNDIKSITVLKDVASTSEYGFQGAHGVILIRLKKGPEK